MAEYLVIMMDLLMLFLVRFLGNYLALLGS